MRAPRLTLLSSSVLLLLAALAEAHGGSYYIPKNRRPSGRKPDPVPIAGTPWDTVFTLNREPMLGLRGLTGERIRARSPGGTPHFFSGFVPGRGGDERKRAAWNLIIDALLTAARDPDHDVSTGAIVALGKAGDPRAIRILLDLLRTETHHTVDESAVLALGMIGKGGTQISRILTGVAEDPEQKIRTRAFACLALGLYGDEGTLPALMALTRERADLAPSRKPPPRLPAPRPPKPAAARNPAPRSRTRMLAVIDIPGCALVGIGLIGQDLVVPDLSAKLSGKRHGRETHPILRAYYAAALGKIGSRDAIPHLVRALGDPEKEVRKEQAVLSLGLLVNPEDTEVVKILIRVARFDGDTRTIRPVRDLMTQAYAALVLGRIGASDAFDLLVSAYHTGYPYLHEYAAMGLALLAKNGTPADRTWIRAFLRKQLKKSENAEHIGLIALCLGIAGDAKASEHLVRIVTKSKNDTLRARAALSLGLIGAHDARPALRKLLTGKTSIHLKREAALALSLLGDREALPALMALLTDSPSEHVRGGAAVALGRLATPETAKALVEILIDAEKPALLRAYSAVALGMVVDRRPDPLLSRITEHLNPSMAVPALKELLDLF